MKQAFDAPEAGSPVVAERAELQASADPEEALRRLGKNRDEARRERKGAPWKVAIAAHLRATTQVTNAWRAAAVAMGGPVAVSQDTGRVRRVNDPRSEQVRAWLEKLRRPA